MPIFNPMSVPPWWSHGGKILKQPYFEICTVQRSGPDSGRIRCKMTLREFVPRRCGPRLTVGKEKACVPEGLKDHARVGREKQPGWQHPGPACPLNAATQTSQ